jgi:tRNA-dihydrouridine synthase A
MVNSCSIPVTAKTRIGFDDTEDFDYLNKFIMKIKEAGSTTFIIHARKAILKGLTPKQNLNIPKLNYEMVYKIKKENPDLEIIINGGISKIEEIKNHLKICNGVMIGRSVYHSPYFLAEIEREIFNNDNISSRKEIIENLIPYVKSEIKKGTRLNQIMRHTIGLFHGQTGANFWKKYLSENMCVRDADVQKINHIMDKITFNHLERSVS